MLIHSVMLLGSDGRPTRYSPVRPLIVSDLLGPVFKANL